MLAYCRSSGENVFPAYPRIRRVLKPCTVAFRGPRIPVVIRRLVRYDTEVAERVSRGTLYVIVAQKSRGKQLTRKAQSRVRPAQDQTIVQLRIILERGYLAVVSSHLEALSTPQHSTRIKYSNHSGKPRLIRITKRNIRHVLHVGARQRPRVAIRSPNPTQDAVRSPTRQSPGRRILGTGIRCIGFSPVRT